VVCYPGVFRPESNPRWARRRPPSPATELKLKAYLDVVEPVAEGDTAAARERAAPELAALRTEVAAALGL
jgi:hypothetical protein